MIYSQWRPDTGSYDYYDVPTERRGLGDDLPVPAVRASSPIGAASTDAGRPLPGGARLVGRGPVARGSIAPMTRAGLSGAAGRALGLVVTGSDIFLVGIGAVAGWWVARKWSKR